MIRGPKTVGQGGRRCSLSLWLEDLPTEMTSSSAARRRFMLAKGADGEVPQTHYQWVSSSSQCIRVMIFGPVR